MLWMEKTKVEILRAMRNSTGDVEVIIACASGTRRSVAGAALLQQVLEKMEGYRTAPVVHISKLDWLQTCNGECAECANEDDISRKLAIKHAESHGRCHGQPPTMKGWAITKGTTKVERCDGRKYLGAK